MLYTVDTQLNAAILYCSAVMHYSRMLQCSRLAATKCLQTPMRGWQDDHSGHVAGHTQCHYRRPSHVVGVTTKAISSH